MVFLSIGNLGFARKPGVSENIQNDIYPYLIDSNVSFKKLSLFMLQVLRKPEVVQSLMISPQLGRGERDGRQEP